MKDKLTRIRGGLTVFLQWLLILALTFLVLDVVWGVVTRYVMGQQASWTEELARFLMVWVALLGSAVAFGTKAHLGVDYFVGKFDPEVRKSVAVLTHTIVLFFAVAIFVIGGCRVVYDALTLEQMTPALGWKIGYVYLVVPISGCFMVLFTIENMLETWRAKPESLVAENSAAESSAAESSRATSSRAASSPTVEVD